jgi:hypothetical protein
LYKIRLNRGKATIWNLAFKPKADADASLPLDEAPGEYCLSKLLGISMHGLWEVLITWDLAKKRGKRGKVLDWNNGFQHFFTKNGLTNVIG